MLNLLWIKAMFPIKICPLQLLSFWNFWLVVWAEQQSSCLESSVGLGSDWNSKSPKLRLFRPTQWPDSPQPGKNSWLNLNIFMFWGIGQRSPQNSSYFPGIFNNSESSVLVPIKKQRQGSTCFGKNLCCDVCTYLWRIYLKSHPKLQSLK